MSKTFAEELDEILDKSRPKVAILHYAAILSQEEAVQAILKLVEERIIGEDREYEKYAKCPNGCYAQYSCRCDAAELNVKSEQRQRLYEGLEHEN